MPLSSTFRLALLALLAVLAGCSATGRFLPVGDPPTWRDPGEHPAPDDGTTEPGALRVILHCPTLEADEGTLEELAGSLLQQFRHAGLGALKLLPRGSARRAQFEVVLYEARKDGVFPFDDEAGIWASVGTKAASSILTESRRRRSGQGTTLDALRTAFGADDAGHAFAGICRQRTSVRAGEMAFAGSAAGSDRTSFLDRPLWNTRTEAVEFPFLFQIAVTGGSRGNKDAADAAVRDVLVEQFPSYITGGTGVGAGYAAEAARPRSRRPTPWPLDPEIVQQQLRSRSLSQQVQRCLQVNVSTSDMVTLLADIDEHLGAHSQSAHGDVTQLVASRARLVRHLLLQQDPQTPSGAETSRVHRTMRLLAPERVAAGTPFTAQVTLDAMPALATPDATAPAEVRFCMVAPGCSFPDGENSQLLRVPTNGPAEAAFFRLLLEDPSMATLPLRCEVWCGSTLVRTLDCEVGVKSPGRLGAQKTLVSVDPTADDEATLTVTASTFGDRTIFTVQGTGMVPQSEAIETSRIRAWLRDRLTEVGPHLRGEDPDAGVSSPARADLDGLGIELWKRVAPEAFRSQFAALRSRFGERFRSIFIYTDDPTVPWELMRPDGADGRAAECLGITHRIGRWHRFGDNRARQSPRKRLTLRDLAVLAPAYPATAQLPAQRREVDFLAAQPGYRAVPATFQGLQAVLSDLPPGIVHFAGHGKATRVGATESYAMVMQDREVTPLAWRGIAADASANGTLFFFNACDMGRGESVGSFVDGFAATIADLGSCGCVAATCRVADAGAAMFAIEFYRRVCSARPGEKVLVAEALRAARAECLNQGFATGLAFVFYGDPDLEVVR